ncbi:myosin heavy chain, striated muscle-like isoform X2 [Homarus americanus]|nr:myosin heavy chain, striated muscle-like isoform X2 [Homarus americanus]XP_042226430.1 myosin heavy chain, striated muscle-like isoform X2 [Homarus americanus]XP_042226431.1 myosin heavy chain, striated muscle-like isoform X2 [Homarus americanus]
MTDEELVKVMAERDQFKHMWMKIQPLIEDVTRKLGELGANYASLVPLIDQKHRLEEMVKQLSQENINLKQASKRELEEMKEQAKTAKLEADLGFMKALNHNKEKAKGREEKILTDLESKNKELEAAKEQIDNQQLSFRTKIEESEKKHHLQMEKLRGCITRQQQLLASHSTSNMDLFANKLQSVRAEFEEQVQEQTSKIDNLEKELQETREALQHQKQLIMIRAVTSSPTLSHNPSLISSPGSTRLPGELDEVTTWHPCVTGLAQLIMFDHQVDRSLSLCSQPLNREVYHLTKSNLSGLVSVHSVYKQ